MSSIFSAAAIPEHQEVDLPARTSTTGAMRKEDVPPAGGAVSGREDILRRQPSLHKRDAVGRSEIKHPPATLAAGMEKSARTRLRGEGGINRGVDLIAADADSRSDRNENILHPRGKSPHEEVNHP